MSSGVKKYRRSRKVVKHANPLFDTWLREWQQEAEKKNSKMKYNFQRARRSLSLYPLPLYTGQECRLIANFGNKICQMLDQRLAQHEEEFGKTDWKQIHKIKGTPRSSKKRETNAAIADSVSSTSKTKAHSQEFLGKTGSEGTPKKRRPLRQYIPLVRSGAYALLLALYRATLQPNYQGFMKKDELITSAQPLCDASLSRPDKVGCYYSAWSSMSTLIKKGLVARHSHPVRFSITEEGKAVALQLEKGNRNDDVEHTEILPSVSPLSWTGREQSCDPSVRTHTLSSSSSSSDDDSDEDVEGGGSNVNCSPCTIQSPSSPQTDHTARENWEEIEEEGKEKETRKKRESRVDPFTFLTHKNHQASRKLPSPQAPITSADYLPMSSKRKPAQSEEASTEKISTVPLTPASTDVSAASSNMQFMLLPGTFEVVLCIDTAETSGKSADSQPGKKDVILSELMRNGVKYDIRKLHVGDYLWVCREVLPHTSMSCGVSRKETRELVLPVVMERKRMDDLVSSIKDGRFKEQKFRLQQCGLSHPVYLVEESHGSVAPGLGMPETTYLQAIVNTQVINGFTVKVVKSQRESAAYLTIMTRYLQNKYKNMTLQSAQLQDLKGIQACSYSDVEKSLPSFCEFNAASMKNQQLTVQEMFAKHLLQLHGVSADKARAVVDKYGTPSLLVAACENTVDTHETKKLLADLKWGKTGRSLGPVLSASIASLYTTPTLQ